MAYRKSVGFSSGEREARAGYGGEAAGEESRATEEPGTRAGATSPGPTVSER